MTRTPARVLNFFAGDADFPTLSEIVEVARAGLASDVRDFLDGGAGREVTCSATGTPATAGPTAPGS